MFCLASSHTRSGSNCIWPLALLPTSTVSASMSITTEGVIWSPSRLLMTTGWPVSSMRAMQEYVVPRSMPQTVVAVLSMAVSGSI